MAGAHWTEREQVALKPVCGVNNKREDGMNVKQETKRIDILKAIGIAVCDCNCQGCQRQICTGAKFIRDAAEAKPNAQVGARA
jgi:hypothetical protein